MRCLWCGGGRGRWCRGRRSVDGRRSPGGAADGPGVRCRAPGAGRRAGASPPGWPTPVAGLPFRCTGIRTVADRVGNRGRTPDTVQRPGRAAPAEVGDIGNPALLRRTGGGTTPTRPAPDAARATPANGARPGGRHRGTRPLLRRTAPGPSDRPDTPAPHTARRPRRTAPARVADPGSPAPAPPRPAGHPASVPGSRASAPYDGGRDGDVVRRWPGSCAGAGGGAVSSGSVGPAAGRGCRISAGGPPVGPCPWWTGGCAPRPGVSRRRAPRPCAELAPRAAVRAAGRRAGR